MLTVLGNIISDSFRPSLKLAGSTFTCLWQEWLNSNVPVAYLPDEMIGLKTRR